MSEALEQAKKAAKLAAKRATDTAKGRSVEDHDPTGDPDLDERRALAIAELGRPLSGEEALNIAAGLPHDHVPPPRPSIEDELRTRPDEHPEEALRRQAAARAAA